MNPGSTAVSRDRKTVSPRALSNRESMVGARYCSSPAGVLTPRQHACRSVPWASGWEASPSPEYKAMYF